MFHKYTPIVALEMKMSVGQEYQSGTLKKENAENRACPHHLKGRHCQGARCFTTYLLVPLKGSVK